MTEKVVRSYKKRHKNIQRRLQIEKDVNKRLVILLKLLEEQNLIKTKLAKEMVKQELEMLSYKYY